MPYNYVATMVLQMQGQQAEMQIDNFIIRAKSQIKLCSHHGFSFETNFFN